MSKINEINLAKALKYIIEYDIEGDKEDRKKALMALPDIYADTASFRQVLSVLTNHSEEISILCRKMYNILEVMKKLIDENEKLKSLNS